MTTTKDQGIFTAVISASSVDREKDVVDPDGMVRALKRWTSTGKNIPLAWNHSGDADQQIGYVDPASAKAVNGEVQVSGFIDQSSAVGADAWRQVKLGTLGFSFGYLVPDGGAIKRSGGGRNIMELDVFEVTATPTPMNNDTRVLAYKSAEAAVDQSARRVPSDGDLRDQVAALGLEMPLTARNLRKRANETTLEAVSGQTAAEWKAAAKAAKREDEQNATSGLRTCVGEMDDVRMEMAVGDDRAIPCRPGSRRKPEPSSRPIGRRRSSEEWRDAMTAAMTYDTQH